MPNSYAIQINPMLYVYMDMTVYSEITFYSSNYQIILMLPMLYILYIFR